VSSDSDQQVMSATQLQFEVAVPEFPDHVDPESYSKFTVVVDAWMLKAIFSDVVAGSCTSTFNSVFIRIAIGLF